jgi:outer membrane protein OmpA-like peptidoglycan-associated protein
LLSGTTPEIESVFRDTKEKFSSRGTEEGAIEVGIVAGAEARITDNWKIYANVNYYGAQRYENVYGNIGVRYILGTKKSRKEEADRREEERRKIEEEKERIRKQKEAERAAEEEEKEKIRKHRQEEAEKRRIAEEDRVKREGEIREDELRKKQEEALARREKENIKSFKLSVANFEVGKYVLTKEAKEYISEIAQDINKYEYAKITVEGHTDSTGSDETNKKLSRQRARSVYEEFIMNEIEAEKIEYIGFSSRMSIDTNETEEGRAANRRTEIFVE